MSVELLHTLSIVSYIVAGVLFLGAVALFFLLDVPKLISDISGRTAKKAIEAIRQQNERTGDKAYKPSAVNASRGRVTDKISPSGRLEQRSSGLSIGAQTEKLDTTELTAAAAQATTLLSNGSETTALSQDESGTTTLLSESELSYPQNNNLNPAAATGVTIEQELRFTGSSELIE